MSITEEWRYLLLAQRKIVTVSIECNTVKS